MLFDGSCSAEGCNRSSHYFIACDVGAFRWLFSGDFSRSS